MIPELNVRVVQGGEYILSRPASGLVEHDREQKLELFAVLSRNDEAVVAAKEPLEKREFSRLLAVKPGSFLSCSRPIARSISRGRTL